MRESRRTGWIGLGIVAAALVVTQACPRSSSDDKKKNKNPGVSVTITNDAGDVMTSIPAFGSMMVSVDGVQPRTHYEFRITPVGQPMVVVGQARLSSDQLGNVPPAILLFDVGVPGTIPGPGIAPVGTYELEVTGPGVDDTSTFTVEPSPAPYVYTCDAAGNVKNTFDYGDPLYAAGGNFAPNAEVHLLPVEDRDSYDELDTLPDDNTNPGGTQGRYMTVATTDANGDLPVTQLTGFSWYGIEGDGFDIVADLAPFGEYNDGSDAADGSGVTGATYQIPDVGSDVDSELACDADGVYQDTFARNADVHIRINPPLKYIIPHRWVDKYVVVHKDEWQDGDPLVDVSGGDEMDGVQSGCTNEPIVIVFPGPIPPGQYDVIIDIDQDGVYDQGLDIVDGGSAESLTKVGFTVN